MAKSEDEIVVGDAPASDSPAVTSTRAVDVGVSLALLAFAGVLAFDNWRTGMGWDATGPQAGYFPFYLSVILAAASVWGLAKELFARGQASASFVTILRETGDSLLWQPGPLSFHDELGRLGEAIGFTGLLTLIWAAYLVFRPLAAPRSFPTGETRHAARELVRRHGADTLAYFKLRRDQHYLFSADRRAFLGYRVEAGVLLVSGDPVGPDDAIPGLLHELSVFAETRGLRIAAIGAGERLRPLWKQLGLHSLYLGDEAVVETGSFSLDGRPIRKVRQSVTRLEKQGYRWPTERVGRTTALFSFDHIFARGLTRPAEAVAAGVVRDNLGASDHRPVWADLDLEPTPGRPGAPAGMPPIR